MFEFYVWFLVFSVSVFSACTFSLHLIMCPNGIKTYNFDPFILTPSYSSTQISTSFHDNWAVEAPVLLGPQGKSSSFVKCLGLASKYVWFDRDLQWPAIRLRGESPEHHRKFPLWDRLVNSWPSLPQSLKKKNRGWMNNLFPKPTGLVIH